MLWTWMTFTRTGTPRESLARKVRQNTSLALIPIDSRCCRQTIDSLVRHGPDITGIVGVWPLDKISSTAAQSNWLGIPSHPVLHHIQHDQGYPWSRVLA